MHDLVPKLFLLSSDWLLRSEPGYFGRSLVSGSLCTESCFRLNRRRGTVTLNCTQEACRKKDYKSSYENRCYLPEFKTINVSLRKFKTWVHIFINWFLIFSLNGERKRMRKVATTQRTYELGAFRGGARVFA